ncbi:MAG: hypothetical protein JST00_02520 [Deltaproteobacteria bacterium]|nr:hypothetical protein [Deltaproteobacteria bacterium]
MGARYRWGTAVVVAVALAAGVGGTVFLVKQYEQDGKGARDGDLADASADASVARGKGKGGKKGARVGKPRGGGGRTGPRGGGSHGGVGGAGAGASSGAGGQASGGHAGSDNGAADNGGDDGDDETVTEERKPPPFRGRGPAGPTYEAAMASNDQEITMGQKGTPDLTDAQLSAPMRNGAFVGECAAPDTMKVTVHVAIKMGRPVGVSVSTSPPDPDVAGCIDRYVRTFSWPSSPKMDSFKTTY